MLEVLFATIGFVFLVLGDSIRVRDNMARHLGAFNLSRSFRISWILHRRLSFFL